MLSKKNLAISFLVIDFVNSTKCAILIKQSTIMNIEPYKPKAGSSMIKSIETEEYDCSGIGNG